MPEEFLHAHHGALNLRHVRRIRVEPRKDTYPLHYAIMDDGKEYQVDLGSEALDQLCTRLIPAGPEDRAVFLSFDAENPTPETVWEQHVKIIAWAVSTNYGGGYGSPEPIYAEKPTSNEVALVRCPDGSWSMPGEGHFATLEAAKVEILRERFATAVGEGA
nr:hypothetical protein [uncultured Roseococcus sp.]